MEIAREVIAQVPGLYINYVNTATKELQEMYAHMPVELARAMKSLGWWMKKNIDEGIKANAPGGMPYPEVKGTKAYPWDIHAARQSRESYPIWAVGAPKRQEDPQGRKPLGKLRKAIMYRFYEDSLSTNVGWLTADAESKGLLSELGKSRWGGTSVAITPKMRKLFLAIGQPLKKERTSIIMPRRATIQPEFRQHKGEVIDYVQKHIDAYVRGERLE